MKASYNGSSSSLQQISIRGNPMRALVHQPVTKLALLAFSHVGLALAMRASPLISTAHALLTLAVGFFVALLAKDTRKAAYAAAYIAGAEVLWRMTGAQVFWEAGKYFTVLLVVVALLRMRKWKRAGGPLVYIILLLFSVPLTIASLGLSASFSTISFNISGPLSLAVCALYFLQISYDAKKLKQTILWLILPMFGIAALALYGVVSAETIVFTDESNFATSGGFGPNQVSAVLGLAGGVLLVLFLTERASIRNWIILLLSIGFLALSALTFSRGGLYNAAAMFLMALAHTFRSSRSRLTAILVLIVVGLVGGYFLYPRLNAFTGGMLGQRFSDLDTTSRNRIAEADIRIWLANPFLGVGPGIAQQARIIFLGKVDAAHTEYTRILAEHGSFGLLALLILIGMAFQAYRRAPTLWAQIWTAALLAWPLLEMSHAAMRIVAISFIFGLALVNWEKPDAKAEQTAAA